MSTFSSNPAVVNPNGLPIIEAKRDLVVKVTANDVRRGKRLDSHECAFAKACKRQGASEATILRRVTYLKFEKHIVRYRTPESAARELIVFDRGGAFAAGTYVFRPFGKNSRLVRNGGTSNAVRKGRKPYPKKNDQRMPPHVTTLVRTSGS
jgi:hypothetical protein